jgi:hypothetical protein
MSTIRHNWTKEEIIAIYNKPMMDLLKQLPSIENITIQMWFRYPLYCSIKLAVVQKIVATVLKQQGTIPRLKGMI